MEMPDLVNLPLGIQTALGAGYLAYIIAYSGLREKHGAQDAIFLTLAFGILPGLVMATRDGRPVEWTIALAVVAAVCLGAFWRRLGRGWAKRALSAAEVHHDDGLHSGWTSLIQAARYTGAIEVTLKDGRALRLMNRDAFSGAPFHGLLLGSDGSVVMVVEEEQSPDGEAQRWANLVDPTWGTRMTYVPAEEVARVELQVRS